MTRIVSKYFFGAAGLLGVYLTACSAPSLQLQCHALQTRLGNGDLSEDQRRFARMELEACQDDLRRAQESDSLRWEKVHGDFTPEE